MVLEYLIAYRCNFFVVEVFLFCDGKMWLCLMVELSKRMNICIGRKSFELI